ncbi:hypothetical protein A8D95_15650 [Burkholderia cenocepacia]|uniref:DUF551 domain-containing protein n=2 Tax=Burkholderia cenocepacia TaxID=95486 RepID=A0A1V2W3V1_9BURK|nr:hypothetical protein A8D83_11840 [Burkholderia cenocepacia]ONJ30241.1 hypothetical protein A8D90_07370 [Burkholderia cenocepacia]ONP29590.1 hypothetical protein A8D84_15170 [Burkholderia cenocepacia]ONP33561.1 hypothetical protein A8D85_27160 [Burkholderia cenocepacia]ONP39179.1 hypothetical protein A8D87_34675 [Burkholderia cenocepacia]
MLEGRLMTKQTILSREEVISLSEQFKWYEADVERFDILGFADALQKRVCDEPSAEVTGWQPIDTAPTGELVTVFWLDNEDEKHPERYDFDQIEDGCWMAWTDHYEWAHSVAPAGSRMPREQPPYTHWKPLGAPLPDPANVAAESPDWIKNALPPEGA